MSTRPDNNVKAGQVLELLLPFLDGAEHLPGPVVELTTAVTLTSEAPELDTGTTGADTGDDAPLGVTDEFFHTV